MCTTSTDTQLGKEHLKIVTVPVPDLTNLASELIEKIWIRLQGGTVKAEFCRILNKCLL